MSLFILYNLSQAGILSPTQGRCAQQSVPNWEIWPKFLSSESFTQSSCSDSLAVIANIPPRIYDTPYLRQLGPCLW